MSLRAQTSFFGAGFANLHQLVLHQLSDEKTGSRHPVLPLLQVSRYWRAFAREFLLEPYQRTQLVEDAELEDKGYGYLGPTLTEGAYVKVSPGHR
jgi:hypothetical protein